MTAAHCARDKKKTNGVDSFTLIRIKTSEGRLPIKHTLWCSRLSLNDEKDKSERITDLWKEKRVKWHQSVHEENIVSTKFANVRHFRDMGADLGIKVNKKNGHLLFSLRSKLWSILNVTGCSTRKRVKWDFCLINCLTCDRRGAAENKGLMTSVEKESCFKVSASCYIYMKIMKKKFSFTLRFIFRFFSLEQHALINRSHH